MRYKENWPNDYGKQKRIDEAAIRSLKGVNKGRKGMREALGMNLETPIEDAIKRFWVLGEFLGLGQLKKSAKVNSELKKRKNLVNYYKLQITNLRKKLEEDEDQAKERIRIADDKIMQNAVLAREKMDMTRDIAGAKLGVEKMKRTAEDQRTKAMSKKK